MAPTTGFWSNPNVAPALIMGGFNFGGGLLGGLGQARQQEAANQLSQQQALLNAQLGLAGNVYEATAGLNRDLAQLGYNRDVQGAQLAQADPLQAQRARGQMALMADILPGLRNASITPPAGLRGYMPTLEGGFRIPEGGFSQSALNFFSPGARASAEGQFYSAAAPFMRPPDLSSVGYGDYGIGPTQGAMGARSSFEREQARQRQAQIDAITGYQQAGQGAINQYAASPDATENLAERREGKGPGFWRKLLGTALPIAAAFIPGVGPLASVWAQAALQAGAGAAGSAIGGGNPLMGAAMGGLMGGLGARFGPAGMYGNPRNPAGYVGNQVNQISSRLGALDTASPAAAYVPQQVADIDARLGRLG